MMARGREIHISVSAPAEQKVTDLMAALERSITEAKASRDRLVTARETVRTTPVGARVRVTWTNPPDSDHPRRSCPYPDGCTGCVDTIDGTVLEVDHDSVTVAATEGTEVYTLGETFTVYAVELADGRATLEVL